MKSIAVLAFLSFQVVFSNRQVDEEKYRDDTKRNVRKLRNIRRIKRRSLQELNRHGYNISSIPNYMQISYASTLRPFNKARDTPFFWHIPKAGGTSVKGYLSECIGLVEASEVGIQGGHENDTVSTKAQNLLPVLFHKCIF